MLVNRLSWSCRAVCNNCDRSHMGHDSVILVSDYFTRRVGGSSSEKLEASFHATVIASDPFNDWGGGGDK